MRKKAKFVTLLIGAVLLMLLAHAFIGWRIYRFFNDNRASLTEAENFWHEAQEEFVSWRIPFFDNRASLTTIERFWRENREELEDYVSGKISEFDLRFLRGAGIIVKDIYRDESGEDVGNVKFYCGGCGLSIGPSAYVGLIYSISGEPDSMGWVNPAWEVTQDKIYIVQDPRHKTTLTRLDEHWFMYEDEWN